MSGCVMERYCVFWSHTHTHTHVVTPTDEYWNTNPHPLPGATLITLLGTTERDGGVDGSLPRPLCSLSMINMAILFSRHL